MKITKSEIQAKCNEIKGLIQTVEKGQGTSKTECYIYFECGKLHLMAMEYAKNDTKGLSSTGIETLEEFDCFDDPKQYILAIQILIFYLLDLTEYDYTKIIDIVKRRKMQYLVIA